MCYNVGIVNSNYFDLELVQLTTDNDSKTPVYVDVIQNDEAKTRIFRSKAVSANLTSCETSSSSISNQSICTRDVITANGAKPDEWLAFKHQGKAVCLSEGAKQVNKAKLCGHTLSVQTKKKTGIGMVRMLYEETLKIFIRQKQLVPCIINAKLEKKYYTKNRAGGEITDHRPIIMNCHSRQFSYWKYPTI